MDLRKKTVLIIGLSRSGYAAALLAKKQKARVLVSEVLQNKQMQDKASILRKKGIAVELGVHSTAFLEKADMLVVSPGVKNKAFPVIWAKEHKKAMYSELEFASWFCRKPIVAITGSNGKTTVTTLLHKIFKKSGRGSVIGGNIGTPFSQIITRANNADLVVLEVSSFQLELIDNFHPKAAIILNISRNHLDHHKDVREYFLAKKSITKNQTKKDLLVLNYNDPRLKRLSRGVKSKVALFSSKTIPSQVKYTCRQEAQEIIVHQAGKKDRCIDINECRLKGKHNIENIMAAALVALDFGVTLKDVKSVIKKFKGLKHRCQNIRTYEKINFVNDSKSTTVDATLKALSMFGQKKVILICGGRDKGSNFRTIAPMVKRKVKLIIAIGEAKAKIKAMLAGAAHLEYAKDLNHALNLALKSAKAHDTVLLSPMCASFDMFNGFEHRGEVFEKIVKKLG